MPRVSHEPENVYVKRRLRPVLDVLRKNTALRDEYLKYTSQRGGDLVLMVRRLQTAWWASREPQFAPFFVLTLVEFTKGGCLLNRGFVRQARASEIGYVKRQLRPVLDVLRKNTALRDEYLKYTSQRGGDLVLMVRRLQTAWWASRRPQFAPFFVLTLAEYSTSLKRI